MKRLFIPFLALSLFVSVALASASDILLQVKSGESLSICARQSYVLEVLSDNGEVPKDMEWSTSDDEVIWVCSDDRIMAVGLGSATLTGEAKDGSGERVKVKVTVPKIYTTHDSIIVDSAEGVEFGYAFNISGYMSVSAEGKCFATEPLDDIGEINMCRVVPVKAGTGSIVFSANGKTIKTVKIEVKKAAMENTTVPTASPTATPTSVSEETSTNGEQLYYASKVTKKVHCATCPEAERLKEKPAICEVFSSRIQACDRGYVPCELCIQL